LKKQKIYDEPTSRREYLKKTAKAVLQGVEVRQHVMVIVVEIVPRLLEG